MALDNRAYVKSGCGKALRGEPCSAEPCCRVEANRRGWLNIAPGVSVELAFEPMVGPLYIGQYLMGGGWRWYEAGQLWGPSSRWEWLCRFRAWRGFRRGY